MAKLCVFAVVVTLYIGLKVEASPFQLQKITLFDSLDLAESRMPDACKGESFCLEKGDNYPDDEIAELWSDIRELLLSDPNDQETDIGDGRQEETQTSIGDRKNCTLAESDSDEVLYASNSTDKPIYYILDENDKVRVVVQAPAFQQDTILQWCLNEGPIRGDNSLFPIECVTCRMDFDFFVLSDEKDKIEFARAKGGVPVGCKCEYKYKH